MSEFQSLSQKFPSFTHPRGRFCLHQIPNLRSYFLNTLPPESHGHPPRRSIPVDQNRKTIRFTMSIYRLFEIKRFSALVRLRFQVRRRRDL